MVFEQYAIRGLAQPLNEGLSSRIYAAMQRIDDYLAYRRTIRSLSGLSADALSDLGLHPSEIRRAARESVYGTQW